MNFLETNNLLSILDAIMQAREKERILRESSHRREWTVHDSLLTYP